MRDNSAVSKAWRQANPAKTLLYDARRRSRMRGGLCDLTLADVEKAISSWTCSYCQSAVGTSSGGIRPQSATLDKLLPDLGYTARNTVLACHSCNVAKGPHTPEQFRAWADKIEILIKRQNPTEETNG